MNSHLFYNWHRLLSGSKKLSENQFRDMLILEIITKYGEQKRDISASSLSIPSRSCILWHGSKQVQDVSTVDYMERDRSLNENVRTVHFSLLYVRYWEEIAILISTSFAKIRQLRYEHIERKFTQPN